MALIDRINPHIKTIQISDIRKFDMEVSKIPDIIKLTLGEPDFTTPEHVKQAGVAAINENVTRYSEMNGFFELRKAAANFIKEKYNISYNPKTEIIATVGATEALSATLFTILEPGDKVLVPMPIYPGYLPLIAMAGATPILLDASNNGFVLTPEHIDEAMKKHSKKVKAIILNYPSNPTGVTYLRKEIFKLANTLQKYEIFVISDEIYSELTYEETHVSFGEYLFNQTIVINGLSKSHAMTGWRIGFTFAPEKFTQEILKAHQYLVTTTSSISQKAAIEALTKGMNDAVAMRKEYQKRRDFVYQEMGKLNFEIARPAGAFYIFAKIPQGHLQNSFAFCHDLAVRGKVALIPGSAFGEAGESYVRVSYAADMEKLVKAMTRLKGYML
ncbi:MAG: pyridoxal phosphate-dependent aminotransferase [Lactobacillales bacterium]|jgi:aminotransferase|nr:pyridoxal phosphate-dependent aminotransferase [Lactobacillales bacterium]